MPVCVGRKELMEHLCFSAGLDQGAACGASNCKKIPSPFQAIKSLKLQQTAEWPPFSLALTILLVLSYLYFVI